MHRFRRQPASSARALRRGAGVLLLALVVAGAYLVLRETGPLPRSPAQTIDAAAPDPFAYSEQRREELEGRAASGLAHVLYAKSPGGIVASARRTARWRELIEDVAAEGGLDPDLVEAIVLLESAGRPDAAADSQLEGAVGLTQILAGTGQSLLEMRVEVRASRRLTRRIARARRAGRESRARALAAERRRVDERFDPRAALEGTARYLSFARGKLGRDDLAVVSYHMGVGNLGDVIEDFGEDAEPSYARLFFGSTPTRHAAAHRRLRGLGDDSSTYYWRVLAAREVMRLLREDPAELDRRAELQTAKGSAEEVLHPEDEAEPFADPDALEDAWRDGEVRTFPDAPGRTGLGRDRRMGELAMRLERGRALYRGLRPEAYALAVYMARMVREGGGGRAPLTVTSTVRDEAYQALLARGNPEATDGYSLHTTGWSFDVSRAYASGAQAEAFQSALDRLTALDLIAWVREPGAIHVTVSSDAEALLPLLEE